MKKLLLLLAMSVSVQCFGQTGIYYDDSVFFRPESLERMKKQVTEETFLPEVFDPEGACVVRLVSNRRFAAMYEKPEDSGYALANTRKYDDVCLITFNDFYFMEYEIHKFKTTLVHEIAAHVYPLGHAKNKKSLRSEIADVNQILSVSDVIFMAIYFNSGEFQK